MGINFTVYLYDVREGWDALSPFIFNKLIMLTIKHTIHSLVIPVHQNFKPRIGPTQQPMEHCMSFSFFKNGSNSTSVKALFFCIPESERKQEGDGFDQVGTNPCNSMLYFLQFSHNIHLLGLFYASLIKDSFE